MQPQNFFPNPQDGSPPNYVDLSGALVADGVTPDELNIVRAQEKAPRNSVFVLPNKPVFLDALPHEFWNYLGEPVAFNADFRTSSMGGWGFSSLIQLGYGTAGIQTTAGLSEGTCTFRNFRIHGPGRGVGSDGKEANGDWSRDLGKYVHSGINADNKTLVEDVNIWHMTGSAVRGYGWREKFATGRPILVLGNLGADFFFRPNEAAILYEAKHGWGVEVQGVTSTIGGVSDVGNYLYINPQKGITAGDQILVSLIPQGGALIADNADFSRVNTQFNGGAGYFFKGNDSNMHLLLHGTNASNGMHALADYTQFGINVVGQHWADNGLNFKDTEEKVPSCHMEAGEIAHCYDETGGAPIYLGPKAIATGTMRLESGITGPGAQFGRTSKNFWAGGAHFEDKGISFADGRSQPLMMRNFPGNKFGLGYGEEAAGQSPHPLMIPVRAGDHLTNDDGKLDTASRTNIPLDGVYVPALYVKGAGRFTANSLQEHLGSLGDREAVAGDTLTIKGETSGPQSYICKKGGTAETCLFQATSVGIGPVADRPALNTLTRHDEGFGWISRATGTQATYLGEAWVNPTPPVALGPLVSQFVHDDNPAFSYSPGGWNDNPVAGNPNYRGGTVRTRSGLDGPQTIDYYFTSQGQPDESLSLYMVPDNGALFGIYLNDELVIERTEADGPFLSHGERVVQHFQTTPFWGGEPPEAYPACILQPAPGANHLRVVSYTPGGNGTNLFWEGCYEVIRPATN